jgi:hypothetical protein
MKEDEDKAMMSKFGLNDRAGFSCTLLEDCW